MPNDWKEICDVLGRSVLINCQSYSYTKRYRAYWTNFYHESDLPPHDPKLNPNECMIGNRTIIQYEACSRMNVRPLGARWKDGKSTSSRPIMVNDPKFEQLQHLLPEEAEALHGYQVGCTAGNDATADQRLKAIGNGWDLNVISMILSRSRLCRDAFIAKTMVSMHTTLHPQDMAEVLMQLEPEVRQYHLHLLQQQLTAPAVHGSSRQQLPSDDLLHQTQIMVPSDDPLHQAQIKHTTPQRDGLLHQSDDLLHQHTATQRDGLLHDDDYNLFDEKLTVRIPKISISLSDNITNHLGTQK